MKRNKKFLKLAEKSNGDIFWKIIHMEPLGEIRIWTKGEEFVITPDLQEYFTNTKLTTKALIEKEKLTVHGSLTDVGLYDNRTQTKGKVSARTKAASTEEFPNAVGKLLSPSLSLTTIEEEESADLQVEGLKIVISSIIIGIWTRLKTLLGLKLPGHADTLTRASNLIGEIYKLGEIQNEGQN